MNILIIKPSSMGDIVHTLPAVDLVRQQCPDAFLSWVVNDSLVELVNLYPGVDDVIPFRRKRWGRVRHWHEIAGFIGELRQHHFDLALDFQGLFRSGFLAFASGAPRRVGFAEAREGAALFYTDKVAVPANLTHAVDRNVFLVQSVWDIRGEAGMPDLLRPHDAGKVARQIFRKHGLRSSGPVLAVAPGARWLSKRWPARFFAAVLDRVADDLPEVSCWLLGTADERGDASQVARVCQRCRPVNLAGETDVTTLAELLRQSHALLTNDSGPMHLAAALDVPTVALFGPTDPELTGPYGQGHTVFRTTCDQAPCFERECGREGGRTCAEEVPTENVAREVVAKLGHSLKQQQTSAARIALEENVL